jgi:MFS family permease
MIAFDKVRRNGNSKFGQPYFQDMYYGWIIVAVGFISMAFWFGIRSSFSVFYVALLEDYSWSRAQAAWGQSMALITYTVLAPVVGGLVDRFGPRRVIGPGIMILFAGLVLCSTMRSLSQFYVFYGIVMAAGVTSIGIVPYTAILAQWFEENRGLANGIAVSGMGMGTFVLVPLSQHFITLWGWRATFVILGGLALVVLLPINALLLRYKPNHSKPYSIPTNRMKLIGKKHSGKGKKIHIETDLDFKRVMQSGNFWALMLFPLFVIIGIYIILVHNVKFLVDTGVSKMTAALVLALIGVISSLFRIFWGWLSDRIGREKTYTMGMICLCAGAICLILIDLFGKMGVVWLFFIFYGIGWGVTAPMFMTTAADLFKGKTFGLIYGLVEGGIGLGAAFGAWIGGFIFDKTQSYRAAFALAFVVFIISSLFIWIAAPRRAKRIL